jgi:hypothetical protein
VQRTRYWCHSLLPPSCIHLLLQQRIASVASLHRSMLEYYQMFSRQTQEAPYPSASDPQGPSHQNGAYRSPGSSAAQTSHCAYNPNEPPSQRTTRVYSHKRSRTSSESPPSTYRSVPCSYTPSPPPGPSPTYSSRSPSVDQSPRSRDAMAIGSLLSMGPRKPRDNVDESLQNDLMREDISQLRGQ